MRRASLKNADTNTKLKQPSNEALNDPISSDANLEAMEADPLNASSLDTLISKETIDANPEPSTLLLNNTSTLLKQFTADKQRAQLTIEQEKDLAHKAQHGDLAARQTLIEHNIRLVIFLARRYNWVKGMDLADLVSEGSLGLIHAIGRYDGQLGFRFATYAGWWIKQYIERSIMDKSRLVRIPVYLLQEHRKYTKAVNELTLKLQRDPTDDEVAAFTHKNLDWVKEMNGIDQNPELSLDSEISADNDDAGTFLDNLEDQKTTLRPEQHLAAEGLMTLINCWMDNLPPQQREVIALRFGLMGQDPHTIEEVAQLLHVSTSDIKRKQAAALNTLRHQAINLNENLDDLET